MACGFEDGTEPIAFMPFAFAFVGVPLLLDGRVRGIAERTQKRSGIEGFFGKLNKRAPDLRGDFLSQMKSERDLCRRGLAAGCCYGLLSINNGRVVALKKGDLTGSDQRILGRTISGNARAAWKLGYWFSKLGPREVELLFNMEF
jgi:hypothetical protein